MTYAATPMFIWEPQLAIADERRQSLVQLIDSPATLLDYFDCPLPKDMQGQLLHKTVVGDMPVREATLLGVHSGHVNCTDGRYVYMRCSVAENKPLYEYAVMPTHIRVPFTVDEL